MNSKKIELIVGEHTYTVEYDRAAIKKADKDGVLSGKHEALDTIKYALYAGLQKHHEGISLNLCEKIVDTAIFDLNLGIEHFTEVIDELTRVAKTVFTGSGERI